MKKPDWAKRKLLKAYCIEDGEDGYRACSIPLASVANLLRAERRRVVRVIRRLRKNLEPATSSFDEGYLGACDDLLAALGGKR